MKYRKFGNTGYEISALSFGCMRYPIKPGTKEIDQDTTIAMIRRAIDGGVNYFDTAYGYLGGQSEIVLGKALQGGYREKVKIATKLPIWNVNEEADFDRLLNEQLGKLQVDHIDVYLLHGFGSGSFDKAKNLKILDKMEKAMADGRVRHCGFSSHDDCENFIKTVDLYDNWSMTQIQINYMDRNNQAGERGLKYAADKGLAVVAMEPCLGGKLANLTASAAVAFESADKQRAHVQWAFDWLWNYPEVTSVLSGMSAMQHVEDNLVYAEQSAANSMSAGDLGRVRTAEDLINSLVSIPCTDCKYCIPCPQGVNIPRCFNAYNEGGKYGKDAAHGAYGWVKQEERADRCTACAACEEKCPQKIAISAEMPKLAEYFK